MSIPIREQLRRASSFAATHAVALVAGVLLVLALGGEVKLWSEESQPPVLVLRPTRTIERVERVVVEVPVKLPAVPAKTLRKIEEGVGRPLVAVTTDGGAINSSGTAIPGGVAGGEVVVDHLDVPELPEGGTATVTLTPGGDVSVVVVPERRKLIALDPEWAVGVLVDPAGGGDFRGYARASLLRIARAHLVAEAGMERYGGRSTAAGYALVGVEWRF